MPLNTDHSPDLANFSPKLFSKKNITKNTTAKTRGVPRPPLRIIEPNGAPIKKRTIQAKDKVNFLCHSMAWMALF